MSSVQQRPTYTRDQVSKYLDRLKIPQDKRHDHVSHLNPKDTLTYLALLQKHHLAEIPFENLTLHYSPYRQVSVHHQEIFRKIIGDNNGRGGYCMENNYLFGTLLLTLGFTIYAGGGRVFDAGKWTGWSHMVNLVTIGETKYHVDVGFGGDGPTVPMPLDRTGTVQPHISPATARLEWRNIPGNSDPNQRLWIYQIRYENDSDWEFKYCFTELEFLPADYNVMNYFTSTNHKTFFTRTILVDKKILDDKGELAGSVTLFGNVMKWRTHGEKEDEVEFTSEDDRLNALEKHLGIKFGQVERESIRGLASEIK